ncbi:hypothetical protein PN465_01345 [Nodularia spumigena CS-584]|jgi:hypothetical protein|uniref:Uncharacterized protein n=1 Tax=Nodularia spumigena UHCC 0060 TaxID=3110300 RepID=A0ABU5URF8_NODSP|nr:hypothetical protein [Nodularia spumigena]MEA5608858.1 hypothetical protein [Nodularia spumigena UHCC 0060]MEA5615052.1 hypothetical protein [Nodularia spumigena UHCC 0040]AHJ26584.1 hypothetical protein NSP_2280 [Nodularia spumigena CCY9414]MDB9344203.1 hypothetical protein [Nodularia spumigena CS-588/06]MDB9370505.1 hypothetical protein [Nodularia spumigena CS-586/05]
MNQYTLAILTFLLTLSHTHTLAFFDTQNHWAKARREEVELRWVVVFEVGL